MLKRIALIATLALSAVAAHAQGYPTKTVRILVPFAPGSGTDIAARVIAEELKKRTGGIFHVENRPGANGSIATEALARSAPDGYTLGMIPNGPLLVEPAAREARGGRHAYEPDDLVIVGHAFESIFALFVRGDLGVRDYDGLVRLARSRHNGLTFGYGNPMGAVGAAVFGSSESVAFTAVPYRGEPLVMSDIIGGSLDAVFSTIGTALPHVRSGKLRPIAILGNRGSSQLPGVPTFAALKRDAFLSVPSAWGTLSAPRTTDPELVHKLSTHLREILREPEIVAKFDSIGLPVFYTTPEQALKIAKSDYALWLKFFRAGVIHTD